MRQTKGLYTCRLSNFATYEVLRRRCDPGRLGRHRRRRFVVLVGPSGCGKSTLLRMVAGLETITGGEIAIDDRVVNALEPKDRDIAMVFQNYAPYRT